ncbi:MAG: TonB-dependent receptor [Bacteroidetes bacterium]|nr:TonB-dependent receptor [Bacteroidota bacterium]
MKKIISLFCLGVVSMLHGQSSLSGQITDTQNKPVQGAVIELAELHQGTHSDESGKYTLNSLPSKNIKITISALGYATQQLSLTLLSGVNELNVTLQNSAFQMDEVIVSTAFNKLQSQNVMKVEHASVRSLQQKGASTLIEGLATIPGVSQISTGTSIGKPVIRGLSGNRVLVYSQGVRVENQQFGEEHGLGLNDSGIESVEVIKGPASLLYGSDALGGVLYFNPEKFAPAHTFKANVSQKFFSNTLGSNTSVGLKTSTENWKFSARGAYNTHADYQISGGDRVTNSRYNETDLKTGVGYSNAHFSSVVRYNYNALNLGIPEDGIGFQTTFRNPDYPRQRVLNHLLSWNNIIYLNRSKLDVDLGYIDNLRSEFEDSPTASLRMNLKTFNYDLKFHLPKTAHTETILGVQGMSQTNKNSGEEYLIPDAHTFDIGGFGTLNYDWNNNTLQAGLRFDHRKVSTESNGILGEEGSFAALDKNYDSFNAALGYKTSPVKNLHLRLNLASGFRAPNLAELSSNGVHEGTNRYEIGNADLKTEQNIQTDLNLEYGNSHWEFFVNGFYNHIQRYIYLSPNGQTLEAHPVFEYVQSDARLYGGEAGLHFHPHPLDWLHFESSFQTVQAERADGTKLPLIPANHWNNTLRGEFNIQKWLSDGYASLNVAHTFEQSHIGTFETPTADYTLVNLGLGGKIKMGKSLIEIQLNANNVFDKKYIAHLSRLKPDGIPNMGRTIVAGMNLSI